LLEKAIDDDLLGLQWRRKKSICKIEDECSLKLRHVFIPKNSKEKVYLPHWVANAATFENGAIFPFTPQHLRTYQIVGYAHQLNYSLISKIIG
jgi:hypothetical protein